MTCDWKATLDLGGGDSLAFDWKGEARRDGGLEMGLEDGVLIVGEGVLEGYLVSIFPSEANSLLSLDIHAGRTLKSAVAKGVDQGGANGAKEILRYHETKAAVADLEVSVA